MPPWGFDLENKKIIIINYIIKTYINRLETSQQSILQDVVLPMNMTNNKMTCQLILTNKVCAAVLLLWVMEAMFNRLLFCCNGHQGTVLRFVEVLTKPPRVQCNRTNRLETSQQSILQDVVLPMKVTYCIHEQ
jgi:hypothetical protein